MNRFNRPIAAQYGVRAIPTLLLFKNGQVIDQYVSSVGPEDRKLVVYTGHLGTLKGLGSVLLRKDALPAAVKGIEGSLARMVKKGLATEDAAKAAIGMQPNGTPSLVIDDPSQIGERFFESSLRFTKTELQEIAYQLAEGELRRRLESALSGSEWEINGSAVRFAITNNSLVSGARLVKGHHVRLR